MKSTKPHLPWQLVWYCGFETEKQSRDFELYLKTGSGKAFAYKRFISEALMKDFKNGRVPKRYVAKGEVRPHGLTKLKAK